VASGLDYALTSSALGMVNLIICPKFQANHYTISASSVSVSFPEQQEDSVMIALKRYS
jgi:hypothetical protein